jgi:signal transduction histidine kinase
MDGTYLKQAADVSLEIPQDVTDAVHDVLADVRADGDDAVLLTRALDLDGESLIPISTGAPVDERVRLVVDDSGFVRSLAVRYNTIYGTESVSVTIRHDLRNDLNVIANHADLVARAPDDGSTPGDPAVIRGKADEALTHIETTRTVADTLVEDADLESVDLVLVVEDLAANVQESFNVSVTTDLPDRALVTANDGVRSVVDNLLENAAEHADTDDPRITVGVDVGSDTIRLRVSDTGPGIDPDQRPLFRTDDDGSGGGLSLVGALVEAYDGDVRVAETDTPGTTVVVDLPRADGS